MLTKEQSAATIAAMPAGAILLDLRNVAKSFGKSVVLRDISLKVAEGEFLTILGESGSGKTTLLRIVAGFEQAIEYFQQATTKDPNYARAYAGLADCYTLIGAYSELSQTDFMLKARAAARRAVELDGNLAEAHTALGLIVQNYDLDWQTAEREFRRAIELNPNYATAHHWYGEHLTWLGRFDEALRENERARQLDPLSLIIAADNGATLYYSRQYDRAIAQFRAVRELDPTFPRTGLIRSAYEQKGLYIDALEEIEKWRHAHGDRPWTWSELAYVYGRSGQQAQAEHALQKLLQLDQREPVDPAAIVWAYVGTGNKDQAFAYLEMGRSGSDDAQGVADSSGFLD
jgi:tetratricopeptide (TPR) repeat protein